MFRMRVIGYNKNLKDFDEEGQIIWDGKEFIFEGKYKDNIKKWFETELKDNQYIKKKVAGSKSPTTIFNAFFEIFGSGYTYFYVTPIEYKDLLGNWG